MLLKYLFYVSFTDGSEYYQNESDISESDDKRSCFYDVMQSIESGKKIKTFSLSDDLNLYTVDLLDGHFEINEVPFFMHEERDLTNFRIIFFRQHTHNFSADFKEKSHEIVYRMGWQANDKDGKNIQRVMEFI